MGSSATGILAYGYDLDGADSWALREVDEYGGIDTGRVAWYDDDNEDEDFPEQGMKRLLASVGFNDTWESGNDYRERMKAAKAQVGVHFEGHGYGENPSYLLAANVVEVEWGDSEVLNLASLMNMPAEHGWDDKLAAALSALGITPTQEQPGWLLCTYYG